MRLIKKGDRFTIKAIGSESVHDKKLAGQEAIATSDFTLGIKKGGGTSRTASLQCGDMKLIKTKRNIYCCSIFVKNIRRASDGNS